MKAKHVQLHPYANIDVNSWALRIRMLREALGLSRPKFAELVGVPPTTLKNYELGYREVSWSFIYALLSKDLTRPLALGLFIDLPLLTTQAELNARGEVQYTIPSLTGCSLHSLAGVMQLMLLRITNMDTTGCIDDAYIARWVNCFNR